MRTTLNIDDDLMQTARALAAEGNQSLGQVVSSLMRRALQPGAANVDRQSGVPVVRVPQNTRPVTADDVRRALDEP